VQLAQGELVTLCFRAIPIDPRHQWTDDPHLNTPIPEAVGVQTDGPSAHSTNDVSDKIIISSHCLSSNLNIAKDDEDNCSITSSTSPKHSSALRTLNGYIPPLRCDETVFSTLPLILNSKKSRFVLSPGSGLTPRSPPIELIQAAGTPCADFYYRSGTNWARLAEPQFRVGDINRNSSV
ncbi:unnamed protein product, partial [Protopolystoma xenopodis]